MNRPTKTEAITRFLKSSTYDDLADRYHIGMECQVNVAPDGGTKIEGTYNGKRWDGYQGIEGQLWKNIRIPWNASTDPEWEDSEQTYDLAAHVESIGLTGWNWKSQKSEWWGFDYDGIAGHAESHTKKLSDDELRDIQSRACEIPWVTARKSTSGKGLHLYVYAEEEGYPAANHNEHMAIGRALLSYISGLVGFDFVAPSDAKAGVLWIWHRKMLGTDGLKLIKRGQDFPLDKIPENWRDHIAVVSRKSHRNIPYFLPEIGDDPDKIFAAITSQRLNTAFDDEHRRFTEYLNSNNCHWYYDSDHHMVVTHTIHMKEAHTDLGLRGIFDTIATGSERGNDKNVFLYPLRGGAWIARRYSRGCAEAKCWDQDESGFTRCYFNKEPDLKIAARTYGGVEQITGSFIFNDGQQAQAAATLLGIDLKIPDQLQGRSVEVRQKESMIGVEIEAYKDIDKKTDDWAIKSGKWRRAIQLRSNPIESTQSLSYDDLLRHLISQSNEDAGWVVKSDNSWREEPDKHVKLALKSLGYTSKETDAIMGSSILRPWSIVNIPFAAEYPGDRQWNRDAANFRVHASDELDPNGCPHWMRILTHLGRGLNDPISESGWCKANGITTGAQYLKLWIASMIQFPFQPLPYLFFFSPQENTGKSTFHDAISILINDRGIAMADNALLNPNGFNGELVNAVLCVIEETSLQGSKIALARIKNWVTSRMFPAHVKNLTPYSIPNCTHWVQFSNFPKACPVFTGDTRITMVQIQPLELTEIIPRRQFMELLEKEAPYFLGELLSIDIPQSNDRLNIPVIDTIEKKAAAESNETVIDAFLREHVFPVPGAVIPLSQLWGKFLIEVDEGDRGQYTKHSLSKEVATKYAKGIWPKDAQMHFGNCSFDPTTPPGNTLMVVDGKLVTSARKKEA